MIKVARKKWIYIKKTSIMQDKTWIIFSFPFFISVNIYLKIYVLHFLYHLLLCIIFLNDLNMLDLVHLISYVLGIIQLKFINLDTNISVSVLRMTCSCTTKKKQTVRNLIYFHFLFFSWKIILLNFVSIGNS